MSLYKDRIRKEILEKLDKQSPEERADKSLKIEGKLVSCEDFKKAHVVMF